MEQNKLMKKRLSIRKKTLQFVDYFVIFAQLFVIRRLTPSFLLQNFLAACNRKSLVDNKDF